MTAAHLDGFAWGRKSRRGLFVFWAHEASLLPLSSQPLLRRRMACAAAGTGKRWLLYSAATRRPTSNRCAASSKRQGLLAASDLGNGGERRGPWWGRNDGKLVLEWLFLAGVVTTATRRGTFERVYDLTERVPPPYVQALLDPSPEEAQRELLRISAHAWA